MILRMFLQVIVLDASQIAFLFSTFSTDYELDRLDLDLTYLIDSIEANASAVRDAAAGGKMNEIESLMKRLDKASKQ